MSTNHEPSENSDPPLSAPSARPARVLQLHAACQLLSEEQSKSDGPPVVPSGPVRKAKAHDLLRALTAILIALAGIGGLIATLSSRSPVHLSSDKRLGVRSDDAETSDAIYDPDRGELLLATRGSWIHTLRLTSGFWDQFYLGSSGGLLSNDVVRMGRGPDGRTFVLSELGGDRSLCSVGPNRDDWRLHVGVTRFQELTDSNPARVTGVTEHEGVLWVATDRAGLGIYDPKLRGWKALLRAKPDELLDDRVHDLTKGPDGSIWLATGSGINRVHAGEWQRFTTPALAGMDIRRLSWEASELWYVTSRGGLGKFDGAKWTTLIGEGSWGTYSDGDVKLACHDPVRDRYWLVSNDRVGCYDRKTRTWVQNVPAPPGVNAVSARIGLDQPVLWAATQTGVWSLQAGASSWNGPALPNQNAVSVDVIGSSAVVGIASTDKTALPSAYVSDANAWKKLTGSGKADIGPAGLLSACLDPTGKRLIVGTEKGLSIYDLATRDWVGHHKVGDEKLATSIIDLQRESDRILGLTPDGVVRSFDPLAGTWKTISGGGRFPGNLTDVKAVTRDRDGRLWLAAQGKGLHRYDPKSRQWTDLATKFKDVSHLAASSDRVWALTNDALYMIDGDKEPQLANLPAMKPTMKPVRLFAAAESNGVVLLDDNDRVVHVRDEGTSAIVVGEKAEGDIHPKLIQSVALLGDVAVVGGPNPHRYDGRSRSWTKLAVPEIAKIVPAYDRFWMLGKGNDRKVYSVGTTGQPVDVTPPGAKIETLAGASKQLVALAADESVLERNDSDQKWPIARSAPNGPKSEVLGEPNLAVAVDGEDLYIAGSSGFWHFSWTNQRWREILDPDNQSFRTAEQLVVAQRRLFLRIGKKVFSAKIGDMKARLEEKLPEIERITLANGYLVAVAIGAAYLTDGEKWLPSLGEANYDIPKNDEPKDAAYIPGTGIVFTGAKGSAILAPGLASWKPISGGAGLKNLQSASDGSVWGVNEEGKLFVARNQPGGWKWEAVDLPENAKVASFSPGSKELGNRHWATTTDGHVHQFAPGKDPKVAWRSPSFAPGSASELVDVVETSTGFLAAFKNGGLAQFHSGTRSWVDLPKVEKIDRLFAMKSRAVNSFWVLGENRDLSTSLDGKEWQLVSKDVGNAVVAGESLVAVSKLTGKLSRIDIVDNKVRVIQTGGASPRELASLKCAGEIRVGPNHSILVLADDSGLLAYDPDKRVWARLDLKAVELHSLKASLIGRTASGIVQRLTWESGKLDAVKLDLGGSVSQLATDGDDRIVAQIEDGRIVTVLSDGTGSQQVTGPFLPKAGEGSKIAGVAGVGRQLLLGTTDGAFAYEHRNGWRVIPNVSAIKKIRSSAGVGWAELDKPAGSLLRLVEKDGKWTSAIASENVRAWHASPDGVIVERAKDGKTETIFVAADGMERLVHTRTLGPYLEQSAGDAAEIGVTSDGKFGYVPTAKGLVVRDTDRKIVAIHRPNDAITGLRWTTGNAGQTRLFVKGTKTVHVVEGDKIENSTLKWEDLPANEVEWNGQRYRGESDKDPTVLRLAPVNAKDSAHVLDLNERGFHSDRVNSLGIAPKSSAVWIASPGQVRMLSLVAGQAAKPFPLNSTDKPELNRLGSRLIARAGTSVVELDEQKGAIAVSLTDAEKSDLAAVFASEHWVVDPKGSISYRSTSRSLLDLGFSLKSGLAVDVATRVAVGKKTIVISTAKGTFQAPLSESGLPKLSDLTAIATEKSNTLGEPDELMAVDEVLYARVGANWFQLSETPARWVELKAQPKNVSDAKSKLGSSTSMQWTRSNNEVHLAEPGPDGNEMKTTLNSIGGKPQFEFDRVRAAVETDKGVWLATDGGIWLTDPNGTNWKPKRINKDDPKGAMHFRRHMEKWFLQIASTNVGTPNLVLKIDGDTIKPVTDGDHPFHKDRVLVDAKSGMRVTSDGSTLNYELLGSDGKLQAVKYLSDQGRFDFQALTDGVGKDKEFFAKAAGKTFAWTVDAGRMNFVRTDQVLPGEISQFTSARWQIGRVGNNPLTIRVLINGRLAILPLHEKGDFQYRRSNQLALSEKEGAWTATDRAVIRFEPGVPWIPHTIWEAEEIGANRNVIGVFSVSGTIYASLNRGLYFRDQAGKWQPAADEKAILNSRDALAASPESIWKVGPDEKLRVERRLNEGIQIQTFDPGVNRFETDQVTDAGIWNNSLWLLSSQGLSRVAADTRQTIGQLKSDAGGWKTLHFDRDQKRLLVLPPKGDTGVALSFEEANVKTGVVAKDVIDRHRGATHADADWKFVLGTAPIVHWRALKSDLMDGLFAHDRFNAIVVDGKDVWTPTPAGILKHSLAADSLQSGRVLPLPTSQPVVELASVGGTIRCLGQQGEAFGWDDGSSTWKTVPASRRMLIDIPMWSWSRPRPGKMELTFNPSDQQSVDPLIAPNGQFVHDGAAAVLADSDVVWLAPGAGIVRQGSDGTVLHWYRNAERDGKSVTLGKIVRIGRFDEQGNTIPSSASNEVLSKAKMFALDSEDQVWKFSKGGAGMWVASTTNPWSVHGEKDTEWVVRSKQLGIHRDQTKKLQLSQPTLDGGETTGDPVLLNGRMRTDVAFTIAHQNGRAFIATAAGLTEVNSKDATLLAIWGGANQPVDNLASCKEVFVHPRDGGVYASSPGGTVFKLDGSANRWSPQAVDDAFQTSADVRHRDHFWTWHRWNGVVETRLLAASPAPADWALFSEGRFSFDVLHDIRIEDSVWAITDGGVARFRATDMKLERLDRSAVDRNGSLVSIHAKRFVDTKGLVCEGVGFHYARPDDRWVRTTGSPPPEMNASDGDRNWRVAPMLVDGKADGFEVTLREGETLVWRRHVLRGIDSARLRSVVAVDGRLWVCLDRGVYRITP